MSQGSRPSSDGRRRIRQPARLIAVLATIAAVLLPATAATAADPLPLEFSLDGVSWSVEPPSSLLAPTVLVPGGGVSATLYLRSIRPEQSVLSVSVANVFFSGPAIGDALTLTRTDSSGGRIVVPLSAAVDCTEVLPTQLISEGQVVPVPLNLVLDPGLAGIDAQGQTAGFDIAVGLSDLDAPTLPNGCPIDPEVIPAFPDEESAAGGEIPTTGTEPAPILLIALVMFVLGGLISLTTRRSRRNTLPG